jgi:hypothetical protein
LFGLPRSTAGALLGLILFILLAVISNFGDRMFLYIALLAPGIWANMTLEPWMGTLPISASAYDFLSYAIAYGISAVPPAILGAMFLSRKIEVRVLGFLIFVFYFVSSTFVALLFYRFAMD